ncbi:altered inheritance of mitochondria protein 21 [Xylariomycetidae sp. FL2044]|nr:altered inheritance of mitochondria protein 21 [Xylariomycetidae sp. FL2044]
MSAAAMQSTPAIPPRPSRSQDKDNNGSNMPAVPPRPTKRFNRSVSPNPDRFAPSPLNETFKSPKSPRGSESRLGDTLERSRSVDMPGVGEEGQEYAVAIDELSSSPEAERQGGAGSPKQTRAVAEDLKLFAPKPTMPAQSAKQRVAAVTRTDSDRAATFGIGRPSADDTLHSANRSLKKKASTTSQLSYQSETQEDEHGIPEIGQRVPMLSFAGDVQAPSPAPPRAPSADGTKAGKHHVRKTSSRSGLHDAPPGSYGLHGHGVASTDKLEKAYYEKHPELQQKEHYSHHHDRVKDYSMSSEDLNKIVRETASRGTGFGTSAQYVGTPSEQVGFQATDEYTSRMSSPRPSSTVPRSEAITSPLKSSFTGPDIAVDDADHGDDDDVIHVDEPRHRQGLVKYGDPISADGADDHENVKVHPILASDETAKHRSPYELQPAVEPPPERHGSVYEMDEPKSRPTSRAASVYSPPPPELRSYPLDDVEEYEPLFPEDEKSGKKPMTQSEKAKERRRFPSQDIWEDAPNSVHSTAEVSTPEPTEGRSKPQAPVLDIPARDGETPAQAFARQQELLAEKEAISPDAFLYRQQKPPSWVGHQSHLTKDMQPRPNMANRFPSRDVWEDTPDSLQFTTTVSTPQSAEAPESPATESPTGADKPTIPARPKKQGSGDDSVPAIAKPVVPARPKPQVPSRPAKSPSAGSPSESAAPKQKPAVPARPVGGKIAALQAGFMSDLNNRLRLGPQAAAPKKEEAKDEDQEEEKKEKAPLSDARKGRARGPQRRAPTAAKSTSPAAPPPSSSSGHPVLSFSMARTLWSIDEEGTMTVDGFGPGSEEVKDTETKDTETKDTDNTKTLGQTESSGASSDEKKVSTATDENNTARVDELSKETASTEDKESKGDEETEQETKKETKSLVTNMAGESILEETVEKKPKTDEVQGVEEARDEVLE